MPEEAEKKDKKKCCKKSDEPAYVIHALSCTPCRGRLSSDGELTIVTKLLHHKDLRIPKNLAPIQTKTQLNMNKTTIRTLLISASVTLCGTMALLAGPPTVNDVGDVDSFQKNARFLGAASGAVALATTCAASPTPSASPSTSPANTTQCFVIDPTPGNTTTVNAPNIARINLPGNAAKDVIYPILTFFNSYNLQNPTAAQVPNALFNYSATITIFSTVLNDPSIVDPVTGNPAGGALTFVFSPNRFIVDRSLEANERAHNAIDYSRAGNAGISKANLISSGLTQHQADDLFNKPMTVRLDVTGSARYLTNAGVTFNMRLFGD